MGWNIQASCQFEILMTFFEMSEANTQRNAGKPQIFGFEFFELNLLPLKHFEDESIVICNYLSII